VKLIDLTQNPENIFGFSLFLRLVFEVFFEGAAHWFHPCYCEDDTDDGEGGADEEDSVWGHFDDAAAQENEEAARCGREDKGERVGGAEESAERVFGGEVLNERLKGDDIETG